VQFIYPQIAKAPEPDTLEHVYGSKPRGIYVLFISL